jgi:hypothetical protein
LELSGFIVEPVTGKADEKYPRQLKHVTGIILDIVFIFKAVAKM